ncbi:uncharacterized protein EDB91DRAFT_1171003 [Suillus paluster]|uniref:uncharacterized protein n=1 Tax=Suillus paluster TaxID=48578 RepID=UPI001B87E3A9|nr:uncharacterized protein EDB91DRAFT_1171003 [Suillus paluster]KAG1724405.1 hypothetical protein EDB91DRAFT_1171003 [Suillus paluster]
MADFRLVNPEGWEYDLQSVYSAYIGYFQLHNVPWYDRTWGQFFETFEQFLGFSWPVITVTDSWTGRAHIVTRLTTVGAFIKMIKTRFGETLPTPDNMLKVTHFETAQRHLRNVADWATYKKLYTTLPAVALAAFKARVRAGEPKAIRELWAKRDKTFLAIDFEWSERNPATFLEWGYAAVRCGHLEAYAFLFCSFLCDYLLLMDLICSVGAWPPAPETNYRKGHYIIGDYVDKIVNKHCPTHPWQYAWGDSQVIPKTKLPQIVQSVISSLASPDTETAANNLVLVGHGVTSDIQRLEETKIKIPHNVLIIDTASFERALFNTGERGAMHDPKTGKLRAQGSTLSLGGLLHSLSIDPPCALHNAGNDAFMCLLALQKMLEPSTSTPRPTLDPDGRRKLKTAGSPSPMAFLGFLTVGSAEGRPMSGYLMSPGGSGSPRVGGGTPDEMGSVRRVSKYGSASPPGTGGSWKEDKDREKGKEGWARSGMGIRSVTK